MKQYHSVLGLFPSEARKTLCESQILLITELALTIQGNKTYSEPSIPQLNGPPQFLFSTFPTSPRPHHCPPMGREVWQRACWSEGDSGLNQLRLKYFTFVNLTTAYACEHNAGSPGRGPEAWVSFASQVINLCFSTGVSNCMSCVLVKLKLKRE